MLVEQLQLTESKLPARQLVELGPVETEDLQQGARGVAIRGLLRDNGCCELMAMRALQRLL